MKNSPYLDKPLRSEAEARGNHAATPGPWLDGKPNRTDGPATESGSHIIYSGSQEIARVYGDKGLPAKANALLIASAPDLLKAAELGLQCARTVADLGAEDGDELAEQISTAIAKAKGD